VVRLQELQKAIQEAEQARHDLDDKNSSAEQEIKKINEEMNEIIAKITKVEEKAKEQKKRAGELHQQVEQLNRGVKQQKNAMRILQEAADRTVQAALLAHVKLPQRGMQDSQADVQESQPESEASEFDPSLPDVFQYNFSQLTSAQQKARSEKARDSQIAKLQQTVEDATRALESMVPNLKAPEDYEQVLKEEKQLKAVCSPNHIVYFCSVLQNPFAE
jgi:chromosome segregation ATPase